MAVNAAYKQLLLIGAGRTHLDVLKGFAQTGHGGLQITLVAPQPVYIDPTLLPAFVAGDLPLEACRVPLDAWIEASGAKLVVAPVQALDPVARRLLLATGDALAYDVASIDVEPLPDREQLEAAMPGVRRHALFSHPHELFVQLWPQIVELAQQRALQLAIIGTGLDTTELAMAAATAVAAPHGSRVTLITGGGPLLADQPPALVRRVERRLEQLGISVLPERAVGFDGRAIELGNGATLLCDAPIVAAHGQPPAWLTASGLGRDESGQLQLNDRLQSETHRQVFVADAHADAHVARVLQANLRTALMAGEFKAVPSPRRPHFHVVNAGGRHAIATWGPLGIEGHEVWNWKERRDRRMLDALRP